MAHPSDVFYRGCEIEGTWTRQSTQDVVLHIVPTVSVSCLLMTRSCQRISHVDPLSLLAFVGMVRSGGTQGSDTDVGVWHGMQLSGYGLSLVIIKCGHPSANSSMPITYLKIGLLPLSRYVRFTLCIWISEACSALWLLKVAGVELAASSIFYYGVSPPR